VNDKYGIIGARSFYLKHRCAFSYGIILLRRSSDHSDYVGDLEAALTQATSSHDGCMCAFIEQQHGVACLGLRQFQALHQLWRQALLQRRLNIHCIGCQDIMRPVTREEAGGGGGEGGGGGGGGGAWCVERASALAER
jgi:hypothetical protein